MTQTTVPTVRVRARVLVFVVAGIAALSLAYACAEVRRSLGDECIKSEDCLSGICSQFVCSASPPLIDAMVENEEAGESETGPAPDSSSSGGGDTGSAAETGSSSSGSEAGGDGASEASGD
jgi:uncharacterized membrane protein YgcG